MPLLKPLVAWVLILCLAVANGGLRESVLIPLLGKTAGLVLSGILLCFCVAVVAWFLVLKSQPITTNQGLLVGFLWLSLTLAFEFSFGRLVQGKSWSELLAAYTFKDGNLWPLVLLITLVAPWGFALFHARSRHAKSGA